MSTNDDPQYNANCPFCGEESLEATIHAVNEHVPLRAGDYDFDEGVPTGTEMLEVICTKCLKEVDRSHYFDHGAGGVPCDCVEDAATPGD